MGKLYIMNTPVLTSYGRYKFEKITLQKVKNLLKKNRNFVSAIGHKSTANALTELLEVKIPFNRITIQMKKGDRAIVIKFKQRLPEGKILTKNELKKIGFEFGLIEKTG